MLLLGALFKPQSTQTHSFVSPTSPLPTPSHTHAHTHTDCHKLLEGTSHSFIHGESLWWCQLVPSLLSNWKLMEAATAGGGGEDAGARIHTWMYTQSRKRGGWARQAPLGQSHCSALMFFLPRPLYRLVFLTLDKPQRKAPDTVSSFSFHVSVSLNVMFSL